MVSTFGFLLRSETYAVDLPDEVDQEFDLAGTAGSSPGNPVSIQCAPKGRVDFSAFGWKQSFEVDAAGYRVQVYESSALPEALMPVWELPSNYLWMQLRGTTSETRSKLLGDLVNGLRVTSDSWGIPRVALSPTLFSGNPYVDQINRDHAIFQVNGSDRTIVLRYDGALGSDGVSLDGQFAFVLVTTQLGVSVLCDGPLETKDALAATARDIATSLRQVA